MTKGEARRLLTIAVQKLDAKKIDLCGAYKEINAVLEVLYNQDTYHYYQCHKCECDCCEPKCES